MSLFVKKHDPIDAAWTIIKGCFLFFWISNMFIMIADLTPTCYLPVGVCRLFCISFLFSTIGKLILFASVILSSVFYLLEKKMLLVTSVQFLLSCIIISHHESNGMFHHATIFTPIFAVQSLAYWQYHRNKNFAIAHYRIQYSIQMIAAAYTLAGLSKIMISGLHWIKSDNNFALQVIKNYSFVYFGTGSVDAMRKGVEMSDYLQSHSYLIIIFLSISLFFELFCFLALLTSSLRIVFGIGLISMHIGILLIMDIPLGVIAPIMVIFFLNPLYLIYQIIFNTLKEGNAPTTFP